MKDYIEIYDENNNTSKMEIVCTFKLQGFKYTYIIYKDNSNHHYLAKYLDNQDNLITDISDKEYEYASKVFDEVTNETRN